MPSRTTDSRVFVGLLAFCMSIACAGCLHNQVVTKAPVMTAPQPESEMPMNVAPDTDASPPEAAPPPAPEISMNVEAPSLDAIPKMRMPSPPPKPPTEQPSPQPVGQASHPPAPQISPQISPTAQQALQRQMDDDLTVAEKNLQQANGRKLNGAQQALLGNARSFVEQARAAGKDGDWARAQNLAHKARLASIDFVNAL
jgi:hypothetical protein